MKTTHSQMRKKKGQAKAVLICALLIVAFSAGAFGLSYVLFFRPGVSDDVPFETGKETVDVDAPVVEGGLYARKPGYYTFLVAGVDDASLNTDVMMLVLLNTNDKKINVVQLPRDTFINKTVGGYSYAVTVNAMYSSHYHTFQTEDRRERAMRNVCSRLEQSLCMQIDRYILVDTAVFRDAIDRIGGVDFDVPMNMDYDDPYQNLHIHLKAGMQTLNGSDAEGLIRFRSGYSSGDLDRIDTRADFMRAALSQVKSKMTLPSFLAIAQSLRENTVTDITTEELIYFTRAVFAVPDENVTVKTVGGSVVQNDETGAWRYFCLNKEAARADINRYLNVYTQSIPESLFDAEGFFTDASVRYLDDYYQS
ncbi:MAG: LCP family protein [Ruminococcus sp.]|nr:LCP family protein [Candidatus Apopatosoma intestinale]